MENPAHQEERLTVRIRQELDKLPLSDGQKEKVLPGLLERARYLDTRGGKRTAGKLRGHSGYFDFAAKTKAVVSHFEEHGLTMEGYLRAALRQPQLFAQKPVTIATNVEGVVARLSGYGLDTKAFLKAAVRNPPLFYQKPERVAGNIQGVVALFSDHGLTMEEYLRAALRYPSLFSRQPETVAANLEAVVHRFEEDGLGMVDYLQAAIKAPQLFAQSARTLIRHAEAIIRLAEIGVFLPPRPGAKRSTARHSLRGEVVAFLLSNPGCLCMSDENIALRETYQRLTNCPPNGRVLLTPRHVVERELERQSLQPGLPPRR